MRVRGWVRSHDVALAAVALVLLWVFGQVAIGEPGLPGEGLAPPVYAVEAPVSAQNVTDPTGPSSPQPTTGCPQTREAHGCVPVAGPVGSVTSSAVAVRGATVTVEPSVAVGLPPVPVPGDCESWRPVLEHFGASPAEVAFFVDAGIFRRESGCGRDTLNESTGDSGVGQLNPVHNRAGWFGGREFGSGGWLLALHGLTVRHDTESIEWANAALTLLRVCGRGPWVPPYSCANRDLP